MKKIFGIGLPKTGQTSLAWAMRTLGYKVNQYPYYPSQIKNNDFVMDTPVALRYKYLDKIYPHSKFILTTRDYNSWIKSIRNHYRQNPAYKRHPKLLMYRLKFWSTTSFNKRLMTKKYYEHLEDVQKYFKGREKDLLVMNIIKDDGWKKLCPFLGKNTLRRPFPKENVGGKYIRHNPKPSGQKR